jgi:hypothetical protein
MKWHCCFGFSVPAGLLVLVPELSLVRCGRPYTMHLDERDIYEFACVRSAEAADKLL